jgi:molecular chaperone DnaK (HSP70)
MQPEAICFNGDGSVKMPSTILSSNGGLIIGSQAQYYIDEIFKLNDEIKLEMLSNFIPSLKRVLSPNGVEFIGGKQYSHLELLTEFFKYLITQIQDHCGNSLIIDGISFSYPVDFDSRQIELIRNGIINAGVAASHEQLEPIAAAHGYALNHQVNEDEILLIFDFGGGTIDIACVQKITDGFRLVCKPRGSNSCGGQDLDKLIYEDLEKKIRRACQIEVSMNGFIDYSILNSCRRIKELFSGKNNFYEINVPIVSNGEFHTYSYALTREAFNNIIYSKVSEAISIAKQVYDDANNSGFRPTKILLIGGSSKVPLIKELLANEFTNIPNETCGEKDIAVALGNLIVDGYVPNQPATKCTTKDTSDLANYDLTRSIKCKSCMSERCFKEVNGHGYYTCLDCGWRGKNIVVRF